MNWESLFVTDNQNRGEPTLAGAGENTQGIVTTAKDYLGLFGRAADTYANAKDAITGKKQSNNADQGTPSPTNATVAKGFLAQYGLWIGIGAAAIVAFFLIRR